MSVASDGTQANYDSAFPSISAFGRFVAFSSSADNLVPGDTNAWPDIFVHDRKTKETTRVNVASDGAQAAGYVPLSDLPAISADGRFVAFNSQADNLVPGDTNGSTDVFVHDRRTRETTRVSVASDGTQQNNNYGWFYFLGISASGRFVSFNSLADNLVPGDTNGALDVFVHDRLTKETTRVSVASDGSQANNASYLGSDLSADGRFVVFYSAADNLVPGDTNGTPDIFVHDRKTKETTRVNVASDGTQAQGLGFVFSVPDISPDGRFVAFASEADNLVPGDTNGATDVFAHDRKTKETTRVSVASDGTQANGGNYGNRFPSISAGGRFVSFWSAADNLVPGDTNGAGDIFVHDRRTRETIRVSVAADGAQANNYSYLGSPLSADGRFVSFWSGADNLVSGDTNGWPDVFVHDRVRCPKGPAVTQAERAVLAPEGGPPLAAVTNRGDQECDDDGECD